MRHDLDDVQRRPFSLFRAVLSILGLGRIRSLASPKSRMALAWYPTPSPLRTALQELMHQRLVRNSPLLRHLAELGE